MSKYFAVFGLRATGTHAGVPATEILYVHSKCMVVDDRVTIIGSGKCNSVRAPQEEQNSTNFGFVKSVTIVHGFRPENECVHYVPSS